MRRHRAVFSKGELITSVRTHHSGCHFPQYGVASSFQDFKRRGWDIAGAAIADRARLDRLLLVLFLDVWWVSQRASACMHEGQRDRFDRHDRRDKGIFRLGRLWLHDLLRRDLQVASLTHCLPFHRKGAALVFSLGF